MQLNITGHHVETTLIVRAIAYANRLQAVGQGELR